MCDYIVRLFYSNTINITESVFLEYDCNFGLLPFTSNINLFMQVSCLNTFYIVSSLRLDFSEYAANG